MVEHGLDCNGPAAVISFVALVRNWPADLSPSHLNLLFNGQPSDATTVVGVDKLVGMTHGGSVPEVRGRFRWNPGLFTQNFRCSWNYQMRA